MLKCCSLWWVWPTMFYLALANEHMSPLHLCQWLLFSCCESSHNSIYCWVCICCRNQTIFLDAKPINCLVLGQETKCSPSILDTILSTWFSTMENCPRKVFLLDVQADFIMNLSDADALCIWQDLLHILLLQSFCQFTSIQPIKSGL